MRMRLGVVRREPVLVEGDEEHERRDAERGGDGAGGGHGPSPDGRQHEVADGDDERRQQEPGTWLKSPLSSSIPVSPASDEDPDDPQRAARRRRARSTSAARLGDGRGRRASRGTTAPASAGAHRSCDDATAALVAARGSPSGRRALWNTPAMSDWPPALPAASVGAVGSAGAGLVAGQRRPLLPARAGAWSAGLRAPAGLHRLHAVRARDRPGHQHQRSGHRVDGARDPLALLDRIDPGPGVRLRGQGPDRAIGRTAERQGHGDRGHRARLDRRRRSSRCSSCSPLAFGDDVDDFDGINSDPSDGVCNEERFLEDPDC